MLTRIITSVVALVVFFAVVFAGELPLRIAIAIVSLAMMYETYKAMTKSVAVKMGGFICGLIMLLGMHFDAAEFSIVLMLTVTMVFLIFLHGKIDYREMFGVSFMTMYITLFMSYIPKLRAEYGLAVMAFIFIIAWGSDTFAYFCGTFFGKHKLIPKVSPKKTVEGSLGAVLCVMLLCMLYMFIMNISGFPLGGENPTYDSYVRVGLMGIVVSAVSQLGDLAASAIKRDTGIKDYGKIFPGHGGFMDRFDSVIFISPIVYYICASFIF